MTEHEFEELTIVGVLEAPRTGREGRGRGEPLRTHHGTVTRLVARVWVVIRASFARFSL